MPSPKKKVTLYFSGGMLDETQHEAIRQDRSISWIIQAAWRHRARGGPPPPRQRDLLGQRIEVGPSMQQQTDRLAQVSLGRLV